MHWWQQHFHYFVASIFIFGLIIGSFLNVIIYRLPLMLKKQWQRQCHEFLNSEPPADDEKMFNLAWPSSHCPNCKHALKPWHNIPLLSYLFLRGRCAFCHELISFQYPAVELLTAGLCTIIAVHFGITEQSFALMILTFGLITLAFIDLNHQILPDDITISFLWMGLLFNYLGLFTSLPSAMLGALLGYLSLWLINFIFKFIMKKEGMGNGDFKLFAMLGAWLGWQLLPFILLISAGVGALVGIVLIVTKKIDRNNPLPFGPYLAAAGWIAAVWGAEIIKWYMI